MKKFLAIGFLIICASTASAQTNTGDATVKTTCTLSVAQAPEINGLKPGMTVEQALARFPGSSEDKIIQADRARAASKLGAGTFTIITEKYSSKGEFAGIGQIIFRYLDGRIYSLRVGFNGPEWKNVDEFISKFAAGSNLPAAASWDTTPGQETQMKSLKCSDLEITIFAGGAGGNLNYVEMRDAASERLIKERRAKAKEQERADAEKQGAKP